MKDLHSPHPPQNMLRETGKSAGASIHSVLATPPPSGATLVMNARVARSRRHMGQVDAEGVANQDCGGR